jgi:hypothetical protein
VVVDLSQSESELESENESESESESELEVILPPKRAKQDVLSIMCGFVVLTGVVMTVSECRYRGDSYQEYELS